MPYGLLADLTVVVHAAFIVFAAAGGVLALRWRWMPWLHLPAVAWAAFIECSGGLCPLTPLENRLRTRAGGSSYEGDFIERYLVPIVYPTGLTRSMQIALAAGLVIANVAVYAVVWRRRRRQTGAARHRIRM
jgi:hypothetical protein